MFNLFGKTPSNSVVISTIFLLLMCWLPEITLSASRHGYVWIVNTNDGTISKVNQTTGTEAARYYTGPRKAPYPDMPGSTPDSLRDVTYWNAVGKGYGLDPSRTAFDKEGNCWVLNIAFPRPNDPNADQLNGVPSITKFLVNPPEPTSHGSTPRAWEGDAAMVKHFSIPAVNSGGRGLTLDKSGYVWVGMFNAGSGGCPDWNGSDGGIGRVYKIDPDNGSIEAEFETHSVYGMATAPSGMVYLISRTCGTVQELNPGSTSCGGGGSPRITKSRLLGDGYRPYAIVIDANGIIWMNAFRGSTREHPVRLYRYDPVSNGMSFAVDSGTELNIPTDPTGFKYYNQGSITVDQGGFIWYVNSMSSTLSKFRPDNPPVRLNSFELSCPPAFQPVGVAITDANDSVIVTFKNGTGSYSPLPGYWVKVHRTNGGTSPVHTLIKSSPDIGNNIYARNDLTGWDPERINRPPICVVADRTVYAGPACFGNASVDNGSYDPDCDPVTITQLPQGPYPIGYTTVTQTITDIFGRIAQCQAIVTVVDNTPPSITCNPPGTQYANSGGCGTNVSWSPPSASDNCGIASVTCNPPSGSYFSVGSHTVTCTAVDQSGNSNSCSFTVNVLDRVNPIIQCPPAISKITDPGTCGAVVSYSATATDNCGVGSISYSPPSGSFFALGTTNVTATATDIYGNSASCTFPVTVTNNPPTLTAPANDSIFQCAPTQICLPFTPGDPDGNYDRTMIQAGKGTLNGNSWCYMPTVDEVLVVTLRAYDKCNAYVDRFFRIVVDINTAPSLTPPTDDSIFQCVPTEVCLPFVATDQDGNYDLTEIIAGPGELRGSTWCFTPPKDTVVNVTLRASDICDSTTDKSFRIVFDLNTAPVLTVPVHDSFFQCRPAEVCLPFTAVDEDGNLTTTQIVSGPGHLEDGNWCYTPTADQIVAVTLRSTDSCGFTDEKSFTQRFDLNQFPVVFCPQDDTLHWGQMYTGLAIATDSDLVTYHAEHLTFSLGQLSPPTASINPTSGAIVWQTKGTDVCVNPFEVIITDGCGDRDTCYFDVCVQNTPPAITCPADTLLFVFGDTVFGSVSAVDPDHGPWPLLYSVVDFTGPGNVVLNPATGSFYWQTFDQAEYTGTFKLTISVTDSAHTCSPCSPENADTCSLYIHVAAGRVCIEKVHDQIQGQFANVSISILPEEFANYPFGGFDLLLQYDQSALSLQKVEPGQFIHDCLWEYFTYRQGSTGNCGSGCPTGLVRIVAIAETNNGAAHPLCYVNESGVSTQLAMLTFLVSNDRTLECQYVPIRFYWEDCLDNTLSSVTGDTLMISHEVFAYFGEAGVDSWVKITDKFASFPTNGGAPQVCDSAGVGAKRHPWRSVDFCNGGVDIVCADSIDARGDINLNGYAYEIADAVLLSRYFVYGLPTFTINVDGQTAASDANADGLVLTVADLVYLIRVIVGDALPVAKVTQQDAIQAHYYFDQRVLTVNSPTPLGALSLTVAGAVTPRLLIDGPVVMWHSEGELTRILVYPAFESGEKSIVGFNGDILEFDGEIVAIEMTSVTGQVISAKSVPDVYALAQNYPNPFNPTTTISFDLPKAGDYRLIIYNVMGQQVAEFTGYSEAARVDVQWNATDQASGIYLYRLESGTFRETKKMILVK